MRAQSPVKLRRCTPSHDQVRLSLTTRRAVRVKRVQFRSALSGSAAPSGGSYAGASASELPQLRSAARGPQLRSSAWRREQQRRGLILRRGRNRRSCSLRVGDFNH
jgi:hypothetical protein